MNLRALFVPLGALSVFFAQPAHASSQVTTYVLNVGTYGNGNVFISLAQTIDEPGCAVQYIELPANGPATKSALATATAALLTGAAVKVKTDGCLNGQPSFTGARASYFQLDKP